MMGNDEPSAFEQAFLNWDGADEALQRDAITIAEATIASLRSRTTHD